MPSIRFFVLSVLVILLLSACGSSAESPTTPPEPAATEVEVQPTTPPPTEQANAGEVLFKTRCASCHNLSELPQVGPGLAGLFSREVLADGRAFSEDALAEFISGGAGAMPGIPLEPDDLDELIGYLREATQ